MVSAKNYDHHDHHGLCKGPRSSWSTSQSLVQRIFAHDRYKMWLVVSTSRLRPILLRPLWTTSSLSSISILTIPAIIHIHIHFRFLLHIDHFYLHPRNICQTRLRPLLSSTLLSSSYRIPCFYNNLLLTELQTILSISITLKSSFSPLNNISPPIYRIKTSGADSQDGIQWREGQTGPTWRGQGQGRP